MSNETKPHVIVVYGKDGCDLCVRLKNEVSAGLARERLEMQIGVDYQNLSTRDGMVAYALSETINGQRIPALQLMKFDEGKKAYCKIRDVRPESRNKATGALNVPVYLQLQTDHTADEPEIQWRQVRELIETAQPMR